jgi:S1-C subfamily serine protease
MRIKFLQALLWIVLLAAGFVAGTSWKNKDADTTSDQNPQAVPVNHATSSARRDLKPHELETIGLFESAAPSVAFITTIDVRMDFWTQNTLEIPRGTGSGFIWNKNGHVVTNYHVIKGADRAQVTLSDRSTWEATLVGVAPEKDLAVLKIEAPANQLQPLPLGTSTDLHVGQDVLAIGNPFGLDQTLTTGIISALGRQIESDAGVPIKDVIQTDAAINPGNSGGPLLDSSGKLIGVNTAIYSPSGASAGIGFSIPVDVVRWVVPELIKHGKIIRPTLGVEFATAQQSGRIGISGALVLNVLRGGPAERAGIEPTYRDRYGRIQLGDVIVGIDDFKVASPADLYAILELYKAGDVVRVKLKRNDSKLEVDLRLAASD